MAQKYSESVDNGEPNDPLTAESRKLFGLGRSKWYFDDGASRMTHPGRGPGAAALKALGDLFFRVLFVVAVLYVVLCLLRWLTGWNISLRP
jgi:hypothetical protein